MYVTKLSLQAVEETVDRPIHNSVINDIKKLIVIDKDTKVFMDTHEPSVNIDRSKDKLGQVRSNNAPRDEYMVVEIEEDNADGFSLDLINNTPGTYPIYYDKEINSKIVTVLHKRTINMSIKYVNKSKSKVNAVLNRLRLMSSKDSMYQKHSLDYHYDLDNYVLGLLSNINDLKNDKLTTPLELEEYIQNTFDNRVDYINSLDGDVSKMSIGIREAQLEVVGYIINEINTLKKEFSESTNTYSLTINYRFNYEKPIALILQYPIMVFNRPIDARYRVKQERKLPKLGLRTKDSQAYYDAFSEKIEKIVKSNDSYIHYPIEDEYEVPKLSDSYKRLFSVIAVVDIDNPNLLFYLDEIPGINIKDSIAEYIKLDGANLSKQYGGLFYFELYNYTKKQYDNKVIIEGVTENIDGVDVDRIKLTTEKPMSIKGEYRLIVSVLEKIFNMEITRKNEMIKLIDNIDIKYKDNPIDTISNSYITMFHIDTINEYILLTDYVAYIKDMPYPNIPKTVAVIGTIVK